MSNGSSPALDRTADDVRSSTGPANDLNYNQKPAPGTHSVTTAQHASSSTYTFTSTSTETSAESLASLFGLTPALSGQIPSQSDGAAKIRAAAPFPSAAIQSAVAAHAVELKKMIVGLTSGTLRISEVDLDGKAQSGPYVGVKTPVVTPGRETLSSAIHARSPPPNVAADLNAAGDGALPSISVDLTAEAPSQVPAGLESTPKPSSKVPRQTPEQIEAKRLIALRKLAERQQRLRQERGVLGKDWLARYGLAPATSSASASKFKPAAGIGDSSNEAATGASSTRVNVDDTLSSEQKRLLTYVDQGRNVFQTGSAGTGKSFTLKAIVSHLRRKGRKVAVTAPTGIAASQIGARTLQSLAMTGVGRSTAEQIVAKILKTREKRQEWSALHTLVIDEISMVSADLFEKVDCVARTLRHSTKPFGGIQLLISGDFYQLPPVPDILVCPKCTCELKDIKGRGKGVTVTCSQRDCRHEWNPTTRYAFESAVWEACNFETVELTRVFRQDDLEFVSVLNEIRKGIYSEDAKQMLEACTRPLDERDQVKATHLYPHKHTVEEENLRFFNELPRGAETHTYVAEDGSNFEDRERARQWLSDLQKYLQAKPTLILTIGVQVMLLTNLDTAAGLVNGSRGVVVGFDRLRDAKGREVFDSPLYPVVYFSNGIQRTIGVHTFDVMLSEKHCLWRKQVPLMYGWAITIHKAQGMSIDKCAMNLGKCFGPGMAYVALSRARSLKGLHLDKSYARGVAVPDHVVKGDAKVHEFYEKVVSAATRAAAESTSARGAKREGSDADVEQAGRQGADAMFEETWIGTLRKAAEDFVRFDRGDAASEQDFLQVARDELARARERNGVRSMSASEALTGLRKVERGTLTTSSTSFASSSGDSSIKLESMSSIVKLESSPFDATSSTTITTAIATKRGIKRERERDDDEPILILDESDDISGQLKTEKMEVNDEEWVPLQPRPRKKENSKSATESAAGLSFFQPSSQPSPTRKARRASQPRVERLSSQPLSTADNVITTTSQTSTASSNSMVDTRNSNVTMENINIKHTNKIEANAISNSSSNRRKRRESAASTSTATPHSLPWSTEPLIALHPPTSTYTTSKRRRRRGRQLTPVLVLD